MIRVKFISICRGGSRRSSTSPSYSPPLPAGGETERMEIPPGRGRRHGTDFPRPRVSLLASFRGRPCACTAGRGARDWLTDGWGNGRSDYWTRGSSTSKLRRIDRINLPPRRNIKAKGGGGGCLDGGGSNDSA